MHLMVNRHCDLKICGLAAATVLDSNGKVRPDLPPLWHLSSVCRFYTAPEVLCGDGENRLVSTAIDLWSAGCIVAELISRKPLLRGSSCVDQVRKIVDLLGPPTEEEIGAVAASRQARDYLNTLRRHTRAGGLAE